MANENLRVLVVDDSIVFRHLVAELLEEVPGLEVVGSASDGEHALRKIEETRPDVLTLDLEMPKLDGLGVLRRMRKEFPNTGAVMLSSHTTAGAEATVAALEEGAFDFVAKPAQGNWGGSTSELREELASRLQTFAANRRNGLPPSRPMSEARSASLGTAPATSKAPAVVAIATSTGGPVALREVLSTLPEGFPAAVLIVQHMPPKFTASLATSLSSRCALEVKEAATSDAVRPGTVFIAPGGQQMKVTADPANPGTAFVIVTDAPPENNCRPSADYLFRSLARVYGDRAMAVVLTGMGTDGLVGVRLMKRKGARVIGEHQSSCVVYGMSRAVIEAGLADEVVPLGQMADRLRRVVRMD